MGSDSAVDPGNRGVSNIVGTIMMLGLVFTVGVAVIIMGFSALQVQQSQVNNEQAEETMATFDSQITDAATSEASRAMSLPRASDVDKFAVRQQGNVTVKLDNGTCSNRIPLTSLRYTVDDNQILAFEAGAVWRSEQGSITQVSPPDLQYQDRTISFRIVNLTGNISGTDPSLTAIANQSRSQTEAVIRELFADDCVRPDNITITIESDYYQGWGRYMGEEFETAVTYDEQNASVSVYLNETYLPREANDEKNLVVDYADWNGSVTPSNVFDIDKGANNSYPMGIQVLSAGTQGGKSKVDPRDPIDVMFTLDESGSMGDQIATTIYEPKASVENSSLDYTDLRYDWSWFGSNWETDPNYIAEQYETVYTEGGSKIFPDWVDDYDGDGFDEKHYRTTETLRASDIVRIEATTRSAAAKSATKTFMSLLNGSYGDRTGLLGFSSDVSPDFTEDTRLYQPLMNASEGSLNSTVMQLHASGGTYMAKGISKTTEHLKNNNDSNSKQYIVLLGDGKHSGPGDLSTAAAEANANDITIYSVGFDVPQGSTAEDNLQLVANETQGTYYPANDTADLQKKFQEIVAEIKPTLVQNDPYHIGTGSQLFLPNKTVGEGSGNVTDYALNDPSVDSDLGFGVSIDDGGTFKLNITEYPCESWESTNETITYQNGTNVTDSNGNPYYKSTCTKANESAPTNISLSSDEDRVKLFTNQNTTADLPNKTSERPWEQGVEEILNDNGLVNGSDIDLRSNQVVLAYELTVNETNVTSNGDFNDIVLLVDLGYAKSEVDVSWAVDIRIVAMEVS